MMLCNGFILRLGVPAYCKGNIYLCFPEKNTACFLFVFLPLFKLIILFLAELPAITRFKADDKVANLG